GDWSSAGARDDLAAYAPVRAVLGNNDGPDVAAWGAPDTLEADLAGLRLAMVHDSGPAAGRGARLRRWFPAADLVVFRHSHIPVDQAAGGQRLFTPGSPTDRGRQPHGTLGSWTSPAGGSWRRPSSRSPDEVPGGRNLSRCGGRCLTLSRQAGTSSRRRPSGDDAGRGVCA